jgi:uncharacterized protein YjbI with pentapeptide repeats
VPGLAQQQRVEKRDLRATMYDTCTLTEIELRECKFRTLKCLRCSGEGLSVEDSEFSGLSLSTTKLRDPVASGLEIRGGKFERGSLQDCQFTSVELKYLTLERCGGDGLSMSSAHLRNLRLERLELPDWRCEGLDADGCQFSSSDFSDARIENCEFRDSRFSRGSLRGARFSGTDFSDVRLENCDIRGLVINGVNIEELIRKAGR